MIWLVGCNGMLGSEIARQIKEKNLDFVGTDRDVDFTDYNAIEKFVSDKDIKFIINCAAYTAVDKAESDAELARKLNEDGPKNLAKICNKIDATLIHISTDYVFDGEGETPFKPYDKRNPINIYGLTKYEGELEVEKYEKSFIVRISWVFGVNGKNFVKTVLNLAKTHNVLNFVNDQIGTPTYTYDLAKLLCDMVESEKYGVYHVTNEGGYISWYDFVLEILNQTGIKGKTVNPVTSDAFVTPAKRPHNSRLDKSCLIENGFTPLPDWKDALHRFLIEIGEINE